MTRGSVGNNTQADQLFSCLAEQVKIPFLQVSYLSGLGDVPVADSQKIHEISQAALKLIDGFLLSIRLQQDSTLPLEPVSASSLLYDTAEVLQPFAKLHDCELQLEVAGKYVPIMARSDVLKSALANIGYSFIGGFAQEDAKQNRTIRLAVRRNAHGVGVGVFADAPLLSSALFRQAKRMQGVSHQPLAQLSGEAMAGVFVAGKLFEELGNPLKVSRFGRMTGLAATFLPSRQLSLV